MATISSQLRLNDGMTPVLHKITRTMRTMLMHMEEMQTSMDENFDQSKFDGVKLAIDDINVSLDKCEDSSNEAARSQKRFNDALEQGGDYANGLLSKLKGIAVAAGAGYGIKQLVGLSDDMAGADARLSLVVDDGGSVDELKNKIFLSAQAARGSYTETMNTVAKLGLMAGDAFSSNDEMIKFTELMNKNFIIGGASAQEQASAMYQLTQAMASGRLQGDEYRSIIENAPLLANSIKSYMEAAGVEGTMKDWASEGLLTADVIKNALFTSTDEIETRFSTMPMTWEQVWTSISNRAIIALNPVLTKINELANNSNVQAGIDLMLDAFSQLANVVLWVFELVMNIAVFFQSNWSTISPIIYGIVAALGAYLIYLGLTKAASLATAAVEGTIAIAKGLHAAATFLTTKATWAQVTAQQGLNGAMYASPVVWILGIIIIIIAAIYGAVAAINHVTGSTVSATGIICGALAVAGAFIANLVIAIINFAIDKVVVIWNFIAAFANFFANVFNDPVGAIARLFADLADIVLSTLQTLASAIDTIFGSNLAGAVQGWRDSLGSWVEDKYGKGVEVMAKINAEDYHIDRLAYGDAWDSGYSFGEGIEDKMSGMFDFENGSDDYSSFDYTPSPVDYNSLEGIAKDTSKIEENTSKSESDLKLLREIAERQAINKFTTAEIKVDMTGMSNTISSNMDIDGFISEFSEKIEEALVSTAEGVHA